eukprot:1346291-Amphidinium_carterae.1
MEVIRTLVGTASAILVPLILLQLCAGPSQMTTSRIEAMSTASPIVAGSVFRATARRAWTTPYGTDSYGQIAFGGLFEGTSHGRMSL